MKPTKRMSATGMLMTHSMRIIPVQRVEQAGELEHEVDGNREDDQRHGAEIGDQRQEP